MTDARHNAPAITLGLGGVVKRGDNQCLPFCIDAPFHFIVSHFLMSAWLSAGRFCWFSFNRTTSLGCCCMFDCIDSDLQ
jgi:hypothetical protein